MIDNALLSDNYQLLRSKIWEIASNYNLNEKELINQLNCEIGKVVDCSRVCFFESDKKKSTHPNLKCTQEWLNSDINSAIGNMIPAYVVEHFEKHYYKQLTLDVALELISPLFRPLLKPFLKNLQAKADLHSTTIFPYEINGHLKGWFTLDVCFAAPYKPYFSPELKEIMLDVMRIISLNQEKRRAEQKLEDAYNKMEKEVIARTAELQQRNQELKEKEDQIINQKTTLETSLEILSHDTKNIYFNLYVLIDQLEDSPAAKLIKENVNELYELTMESAGVLNSKRRIIDLIEIIESIKLTNRRIPFNKFERVQLLYKNRENLFIESSALFKNCISNIIENGIKYSPESEIVKVFIEIKSDKIQISIKDHGKGISSKNRERIFDKYFRIKETENIEGSGRGLWITRNIIEKEQGSLLVENNPEGGSNFTISVPFHRIDNLEQSLLKLSEWFHISFDELKQRAESYEALFEMNNEKPVCQKSAIFNTLLIQLRNENKKGNLNQINKKLKELLNQNPTGKSVLIIDDSIYVHYYLAQHMSELGYNIVGYALNGNEGIEKYKELEPDLITLDNTMPQKTGGELTVELIEDYPDIKILYITAVGKLKTFINGIEKVIKKEQYRVLTKPIKKEELEKALLELD